MSSEILLKLLNILSRASPSFSSFLILLLYSSFSLLSLLFSAAKILWFLPLFSPFSPLSVYLFSPFFSVNLLSWWLCYSLSRMGFKQWSERSVRPKWGKNYEDWLWNVWNWTITDWAISLFSIFSISLFSIFMISMLSIFIIYSVYCTIFYCRAIISCIKCPLIFYCLCLCSFCWSNNDPSSASILN